MTSTTRMITNVCPLVCYRDAVAAMDWLVRVLGFTELMRVTGEGGGVVHGELRFGNGVVMVGSFADDRLHVRPPREVNAATGGVYLIVDGDAIDRHYERASAAGAEVLVPIHDTDYGSRDFAVRDPEGQIWCFGTYGPETAG